MTINTSIKEINNPPEASGKDVFVFPASLAQKRILFFQQIEPGNYAYNNYAAIKLKGKLDTIFLEQSLNEIVRRHETLRTQMAIVKGETVQVVLPGLNLKLPITDLRSISQSEKPSGPLRDRQVKIQELIEGEIKQPFDLTQAPLVRFSLLQLEENEYVLISVIHHIISDGWSVGTMIREMTALYEAFSNHKPSPLGELSIQYADFSIHQQKYLQGEVLDRLLNYWQQQLKNLPVLELPTDKPRPVVETFRGATQSLVLSREQCEALKAFSQQRGVTLFMTLLAAFKTLLYRYAQQEEIVVGTPIAGRNSTQTENLIGVFVNALVLRNSFSGNPSFLEILSRVREVALEAYAHQDLPFEKLVEVLKPERDLGRSPLFQVMFVLQNTPLSRLELPGVTLEPIAIANKTSKYDLTLYMEEVSPEGFCSLQYSMGASSNGGSNSGMAAVFEYNTDLFEADTIARMAEHFQTLLEGIVANPDIPVSELPLLGARERKQLLTEWNDTEAEFPQTTLHQLFEVQAAKTPDAVAIVFEEEPLTYQQLNQRADRLASYLQTLGVGPDVLAGICVERSLEMVIGLLGVLKAGGAYVPIDPAYPPERIALMLSDSQASVLLTQQHLTATLPEHSATKVYLDRDLPETSSTFVPASPSPENLAYLIYTSGSTGKPKGVQIPHRAAVNFLISMQRQPGIAANDVLLAATTISFDIAGLELYLPLVTGARVVLASRTVATDGTQLAEKISASGATMMQATPATWRLLLASSWQGSKNFKILCGGEALPVDLAEQLLSRGSSVWNLYGPTETTIWSTVAKVEANGLEGSSIALGRPIANTQIYLLDAGLQPVPVGVPGEVHIGGAGLARGYLGRPELTAQKFIANPFNEGSKLYKTGDLARYLPDGNIEYIGRIDNQIKLRGLRIELGEIEAVLNQHPAVEEAVAIAKEIKPGDKRLVAYLVSQEKQLSTEEVRNLLKTKLPEYMIPSAFVLLDAFPLTPNGKIDRRALLKTPTDWGVSQKSFVPPGTPAEEKIAAIWSEVLGIEKIGINDNFFEVGGHSLLIIRVHAKIREIFDSNIEVVDLFKHPTISALAKYLNQKGGEHKSTAKLQDRVTRQKKSLTGRQQRMKQIRGKANNN